MIESAEVAGHRLVIRDLTDDDVVPDTSSEWEDWGGGDRVLGEHHRAVIVLDDVVIGSMSWHAVFYGPTMGSRAWSMGIALASQWRGRGWGSLAQRLLADHLLQSASRVEASTDVDNIAEQRSLEKAGFSREGVLRQAQARADAQHDLVMYARTRQ